MLRATAHSFQWASERGLNSAEDVSTGQLGNGIFFYDLSSCHFKTIASPLNKPVFLPVTLAHLSSPSTAAEDELRQPSPSNIR